MINVETFIVGSLEANCYLVYDTSSKSGFLIDPGLFDDKIKEKIVSLGLEIKAIINTHGHADHISGNKKFGYPIFIHKNDSGFLKNPLKNLSLALGTVSISPRAAKLLNDGDEIKSGEIEFKVIHTPGHTPGGISLRLGNKVFTGDTLFRENVGRTDLPNSSQEDLFHSIRDRLMALPDDTEIFPGHGPSSTIGHERKHNPYI
ncbi:MAG: MBL fold metallo-hydrolase [Candidatus Omnitrophota bacterium]